MFVKLSDTDFSTRIGLRALLAGEATLASGTAGS